MRKLLAIGVIVCAAIWATSADARRVRYTSTPTVDIQGLGGFVQSTARGRSLTYTRTVRHHRTAAAYAGGGCNVALAEVRLPNGVSTRVALKYQAKFQGFLNDLYEAGYRPRAIGGYKCRNIAGTRHLSLHAQGAAIDTDQIARNRIDHRVHLPGNVNQIAQKWGLLHGDRHCWAGSPDYGHFQVGGSCSTGRYARTLIGLRNALR